MADSSRFRLSRRHAGWLAVLLLALPAAPAAAALWYEDYQRAVELVDSDCYTAIELLKRCIARHPRDERGKDKGIRVEKIDYFPNFYLAKARNRCGDTEGALRALATARRQGAAASDDFDQLAKEIPQRPAPQPVVVPIDRPAPIEVARTEQPPAMVQPDPAPRPLPDPPPASARPPSFPDPKPQAVGRPLPAPAPQPAETESPADITLAIGTRLRIRCAGCRLAGRTLMAGNVRFALPSGPLELDFGSGLQWKELPAARLDEDLGAFERLFLAASAGHLDEGWRSAPLVHRLALMLFTRDARQAAEVETASGQLFDRLVGLKSLAYHSRLEGLLLRLQKDPRP